MDERDPDAVDERIRQAATEFLRGDVGVPDFTYGFRRAYGEVVHDRPLRGREIDLFDELEAWEAANWAERPGAVDRLRTLARLIVEAR